MTVALPPLRNLIFRTYVVTVGIFGVIGGALFLWTVVLAANITPRLLHLNYDSINAAMEMRESLHAMRHPTEHPVTSKEDYRALFDTALHFAKGNITEVGESDLVERIGKGWAPLRDAPKVDESSFIQINEDLGRLIEINRVGMFKAAEQAQVIKANTIKVSVLFFLVGLLAMIYRADSVATALADPLKRIAESLRAKPKPGEKLRLPNQPESLELRILIQEIRNLWDRVSEADRTNVAQITSQSQKLQAVLASVEDGVLVLGERGVVSHCSDKMLSFIGLPSVLVIGHSWTDLPSMSENYLKLREILTLDLSMDRVFELKSSAGTEFYSGRVRSVLDPEGKSIAKVYLLHNITEVRQRERLKAEFVGVLSHELKTPLQSLGTATELLLEKKSGFDEQTQLLIETVHEDVARIRGVTNDFVQVSSLENQALFLRLQFEPTDLQEQLPRWLKPFRVVAQEKQVSIELAIHCQTAMVNIDPVKFPWVVTNLMSNAIRVTPAQGKIQVDLSADAENVTLAVRDEGAGIPAEIESRIFEPYFKSATGQTDRTAGFLGIGLTIAREVMEAHGGSIRYEKGQPKGAVFSVMLPLLQKRGVNENA